MRILFVATKPPLPSVDGGRLVMSLTLQALQKAGHELCVVAPVIATKDNVAPPNVEGEVTTCGIFVAVPVLPQSRARSLMRSLRERKALTLVRHEYDEMKRAVADCARRFKPDVIHAEQLHALANCVEAAALGLPLVLRMQNVESDLWRQAANSAWYRGPLAVEAARLRRAEVDAIASCAAVFAIAASDASALTAQANSAALQVSYVPPYFPPLLPASKPLAGEPSLVLSGSGGWWPNRTGTRWFIERIWPALKSAVPSANLHVFGGGAVRFEDAKVHAAPDDSMHAFPERAICIVPLHVASGLRMRILEAWARGLPVIATSAAVRGLFVESERELIVADRADEFVSAVKRLQRDTALRDSLVANGRAYLARHHSSAGTTAALSAIYTRATGVVAPRSAATT